MILEIDIHAVKISREDREHPMRSRYSHPPFLKGCESISGREKAENMPVNISGQINLIDLCNAITGIPWQWLRGEKSIPDTPGRWRLVPITHKDGGEFWQWYLRSRRQWYDQKSVAVTSMLRAWVQWMEGVS